tara:strand:- start:5054 stop:5332 length:279 start_codon:yes stop_codon:yes gene_type:complete
MLKEIISHSLDENRGVIYTNIIVSKEEIEKELDLELYIEDLEDYCDLYEDVNWLDYDEYENDSVILQRNLNPLELEYGLSEYLKDNPSLVEF